VSFQVFMNSLVSRSQNLEVTAITDDAERELLLTSPKSKADIVAACKRDAVYTARSESRKSGAGGVAVTITNEAHAIVSEYLKEKELEANAAQSKDSDDAALGVYIRMEEMLLRLMCNAVSLNAGGKALVDKDLALSCIQFHRFQTDRFFCNELAEISKGSGEREMEVVFNGLVKAFSSNMKRAVKISHILQSIKNTKRPKNVGMVLQELVKRGQALLQMQPNKRLEGHKTPYYIPVEDDANDI